ncbi:MAG: 2-methylcitrate dehydratase [Rhodospirillaceae bacterium]|nr:2-methylcitrate dehydratase [Rhodospirillaceae bacterium]
MSNSSVSQVIADWVETIDTEELPSEVVQACADTLIDTVGLSVAACNTDYVTALRNSWTADGPCTVLGSNLKLDAPSAAMINGTAAHGEDFDNTFEGCPVHSGAVIVPALLAAAQSYQLTGQQVLKGLAVGIEVMCRLGLVVQKGVHSAGFHPTGVLGTMGATAGVSAACNLTRNAQVNSAGIAGSMASGIIEYLADGTWTKRMHAGWAAQNGLRATAMALSGFTGPRTVYEGRHGLMFGFSSSENHDYSLLTDNLGQDWWAERIAFKPYACGTMTQPFVDCAARLSKKVSIDDVVSLKCKVGEGTVHRLWEPLADKQMPSNAYAAKFSTPYCVAVGFLTESAGLAEFTEDVVQDKAVINLARKVSYEIDPNDEYPKNYTGTICATLRDGREVEETQPYLRGGINSPLSRADILKKCKANFKYGGYNYEIVGVLSDLADNLKDNNKSLDLGFLNNIPSI